jgi:hypothetical protein
MVRQSRKSGRFAVDAMLDNVSLYWFTNTAAS